MKKHSKADKKKIVAFFLKKCEEYSKMEYKELLELATKKKSSTDNLAYEQTIQKKMMEVMTNKKVEEIQEKQKEEIVKSSPIINLIDEGNKKKWEEAGGGETNTKEA